MSEPPNNLTSKFAALQDLITTQHETLLAKIEDLRGVGPENTLKSINQSIWNMVGAAPGATLVQLLDKLTRINNGLGGYPDGATLPGGVPILSAREYLGQIVSSTSYLSLILDATGYAGDVSILNQLSLLLDQFQTSVVQPTMKDLAVGTLSSIEQLAACCAQMSSNPLTSMPPGVCASPLMSNGTYFIDASLISATPITLALWPSSPGGDFTIDYDAAFNAPALVHCTNAGASNWLSYKIYVASKSDTFGVKKQRGERYSCNQWVTLDIPEVFHPVTGNLINDLSGAYFTVDGTNSLVVYICPIGSGALGSCPGSEDPRSISSWQPTNKPGETGAFLEFADSTGGSTWSSIIQFREEDYWPAQNAIIITRSTPNVGLCIAWNVVGEPDLSRIGVRAFYNDGSGGGSEVAFTVGDIVIATSGTSGSLIREINTSGGYSPTEFALIPYVTFPATHTEAPNIDIAISFVELTAS